MCMINWTTMESFGSASYIVLLPYLSVHKDDQILT